MSRVQDAKASAFHATSVAVDDAAVMIIGPSGSGKSTLALQLIGLGATLVADDRSRVSVKDGNLIVHAPDRYAGVIEARGVGLINVPHSAQAQLKLIVDMGENEMDRLPTSPKFTNVEGFAIRRVLRVDAPYFPSAIFHALRHGWHQDADQTWKSK